MKKTTVQAENVPEKIRRPEVIKRASQLKTQNPKWTENECIAKAKGEYLSSWPNARVTGPTTGRAGVAGARQSSRLELIIDSAVNFAVDVNRTSGPEPKGPCV